MLSSGFIMSTWRVLSFFILGWFVFGTSSRVLSGFEGSLKRPAKKSIDAKGLDHPEPPRSEREQKSALTREVTQQLPKSPRIEVKRRNYIDDFIFGKMQKDGIPHAGLSTDLEFVRRVHLDLTGRIPETDVIRKFLEDQDPHKRDKLIDSLVAPERYQFQESDP